MDQQNQEDPRTDEQSPPAAQPTDEPVEQPVDQTVEKAVEQPAEQPAEQPVEQAAPAELPAPEQPVAELPSPAAEPAVVEQPVEAAPVDETPLAGTPTVVLPTAEAPPVVAPVPPTKPPLEGVIARTVTEVLKEIPAIAQVESARPGLRMPRRSPGGTSGITVTNTAGRFAIEVRLVVIYAPDLSLPTLGNGIRERIRQRLIDQDIDNLGAIDLVFADMIEPAVAA